MKQLLQPVPLLLIFLMGLLFALPKVPNPKSTTRSFKVEVTLTTTAPGDFQVYYKTGPDWAEEKSGRLSVKASNEPQRIEFDLPFGTFYGLRLDPVNNSHQTITNLRVARPDGKTILSIAPESCETNEHVVSCNRSPGVFEFETKPDEVDPILSYSFSKPLVLEIHPISFAVSLVKKALPYWGSLIAGAAAILAILASPWWKNRNASLLDVLGKHPRKLIAVAALVAACASVYPLFLGKSWVTPNVGTLLLYENMPTLPGYSDKTTYDISGSDVGAMLWQHVPYSFVQREALLEHAELPLWNRYNSCGTALLGQGQSCFGDPLQLVLYLFGCSSLAWDVKFLLAKTLFALGLGLLVFEYGRSLAGAALTAALAPFIGYFAFRFNHPAIFSLSYAPWVLLPWVLALRAQSLRQISLVAAVLMGANWCLLTSGTVKEAYMLLISMNAAGILVLAFADMHIRRKLTSFGILALSLLLFVMISSPIWITFLDTLTRSYTSYNNPEAFQLPAYLLIGIFDDIFLRRLTPEHTVYIGSLNFVFLAGFACALTEIGKILGKHPSLKGLLAAAAGIAAIVCGIIPPSWITKIPFIANVTHIDNSFGCALMIPIVVIAGTGFGMIHEAIMRRTPLRWGVPAVIMAGLLFIYLGSIQSTPHVSSVPTLWKHLGSFEAFGTIYVISLFLALAIFVMAAALFIDRKITPLSLSLATILLLLACTWRHSWHLDSGYRKLVSVPGSRAPFTIVPPSIAAIKKAVETEPARVLGVGGTLAQGWSTVYALESLGGPDALMYPSYRTFMDTAKVPRVWDWHYLTYAPEIIGNKFIYDFLGVRFYLDGAGNDLAGKPGFQPFFSGDLNITESSTYWPRAFFTNDIQVVGDARKLVHLLQKNKSHRFAAVMESQLNEIDPGHTLLRSGQPKVFTPAKAYKLSANSTSFEVTTTGPGVIGLHEAFPKKEVTVFVDGKQAKPFTVNYAFTGVRIDAAGTHRITFTYRPRHWSVSVIAALCGLLTAMAGLYVCGRNDRPLTPA